MVSDFAVGILLSLSTAVLFGAHTSFAKTKSVVQSGVAMPIYNIYFLCGAAIANLVEYIVMLSLGATIEFTYLGIICAVLLLCFEVTLLLSIQQIGVGYATGFSVLSAAIVTPILQVILQQPIAIWWVMIVGLLMLACSVFAMSVLRDVLQRLGWHGTSSDYQRTLLPSGVGDIEVEVDSDAELDDLLNDRTPLITQSAPGEEQQQGMAISRCSMILGLVFSSIAGLCMAVLPLPSLYASEASAGLNFFLSFGVGCIVVIPLSATIAVFTLHMSSQPTTTDDDGKKERMMIPYELLYRMASFDNEIWHFKQVVMPAVSAGIVWGIGNICGFCSFLYLSYTIAISFVQCNVIVAMFLGIVLWKEVQNKVEIVTLCFLSLGLVAGCAVVVYGVFGSF
eukprot:CAMPEP_0202686970 /NCGR_PEP_ID=MMETSP1385-20130828/2707_1 /ASSEMBLY_ACC=CAM_ASM_000861 /TAXON_ID=933848 /ORGANISM="Elphidium margaritaceum" /LENGTH=394 /DNA_ID=CAMNT_0049341663 /DNA_START=24 /DNA_END=1208 /DNA_ORIENTATION=+